MHGFMQSCIPSVQQYWHWAPARDKLCRHATRRPRPLNLAISTTNDTARCTLAWLTWNSTRNGITIFKWLSQDTLRTQNIVFIGPVAQTQVIKPPEVVLHWALARMLGDRARAYGESGSYETARLDTQRLARKRYYLFRQYARRQCHKQRQSPQCGNVRN